MITTNITSPIKVEFLQQIFEDDFVEKGMVAYLTKVEWDCDNQCYELHFDFSNFEEQNAPFFEETFYPNIHTDKIDPSRSRLYTAKEAGWYKPQYNVFFCVENDFRDNDDFAESIKEYLKIVE